MERNVISTNYDTKSTSKYVRHAKFIAILLLLLGLIAILFAILYANDVLAFIGLGLTFWGPLLLFITSEDYVKKELIASTATSSIKNITSVLDALNYKGKAIYLPPAFLKSTSDIKIYIPETTLTSLPDFNRIQKNIKKTILQNPKAILIEPSGMSLFNLFESTRKKIFTKKDLKNLEQELRKILIDELEITKEIKYEAKMENVANSSDFQVLNAVKVEIIDTVYLDLCETSNDLYYECPLVSAIACLITKVTEKPIKIQTLNVNKKTKSINVNYQLLESTQIVNPETEILLPQIGRILSIPYLSNSSYIMRIIGTLLLFWTGFIIWQDFTVWGKDIGDILFGSRVGEIISLGANIRLVHYILIAIALIISGIILNKYKSYGVQTKRDEL